MHALAFYMAAAHRQDLLADALADRQARLATADAGVSPLRRTLGRGARGLSGVFASAAKSLDPCAETADAGTARPMAAA